MLIIAYDWDDVILIFTMLLILQSSAHVTTILSPEPLQEIRSRTVNYVLQATDYSLHNLQRLGTPVVTNGFHIAGDAWYTTAVIML
jgi:hypothetical protein